jgi:hypothetical protein
MAALSKSSRQAEKRASGGNNESQDSQEVMDQYMMIYGIGIVSVAFPGYYSLTMRMVHANNNH